MLGQCFGAIFSKRNYNSKRVEHDHFYYATLLLATSYSTIFYLWPFYHATE